MMKKPIVLKTSTFDATLGGKIRFQAIGGNQVFHNEIEVYNNTTGLLVYSKKITTFAFEHEIPPNALTNSTEDEYYIKLRTFDVNNIFSVWSDVVYFKCLQRPTVSIPMLTSGKINNQTALLVGEIVSPQDPLKTYRYRLYDNKKFEIASSDSLYDGLLKYEFAGLLDDNIYYAELMIQTQNDVQVSTGLIPFVADFIAPRIRSTFNLYNNYNNASVKLEAKIIQMFWKSKNNTYTFENETWINLETDTIYLDTDEVFEINGDFTFEIILTGIKEDMPFASFLGKYGELFFVYFKDRIHGYKKLNGINDASKYVHYITLENFPILETDNIYLHVQSVEDKLEMRMEKIIFY